MIRFRQKPRLRAGSRLHRMQDTMSGTASTAAERIGPAARRSRAMAADRVLLAREWSAPQLERAAGYVEADLAPRVSSFLTSTARRIEPPRTGHRARNATLAMLGVVAAVGVAGMVMTRRSAMQSLPEDFAEPAREPATAGDGQVRTP